MSPKSTAQLDELRAEKKQKILAAALKVFSSRGYDNATINLIATEAKIAKGLLYTYYTSKEHLLEELISYGFQKVALIMEEIKLDVPKDKPSFERGIRNVISMFQQEEEFWRLYCMLMLQPQMKDKMQSHIQEFMEGYFIIYINYFTKKKSANPLAEAMLLGAVLDGMMFDMMIAADQYPVEEVIKMIVKKFA